MKIISETRRAHYICYLRFYYKGCWKFIFVWDIEK